MILYINRVSFVKRMIEITRVKVNVAGYGPNISQTGSVLAQSISAFNQEGRGGSHRQFLHPLHVRFILKSKNPGHLFHQPACNGPRCCQAFVFKLFDRFYLDTRVG